MEAELSALASHDARNLAGALNRIFQSVHFDVVNRELRLPRHGGDYDARPFPLPGSPVDVSAMTARLRQGVKTSPAGPERTLARRIQHAFDFFMFGETLQRQSLDELFGEDQASIDEGLKLGLFVSKSRQTVRTNGLSLFSRRLDSGEVIHLFADTPPHFENRIAATPRVYIGADSYELMDRIAVLEVPAGCCVEMGSGSGIQLVSALKHHSSLTKAIGKERDRRALNVSRFNAALNGVADRLTVVEEGADLRAELGGCPLAFAMTNPPFLAMPASITLEGEDEPLDLRSLFPGAGWGGDDGLSVTREFIDHVQPLLGSGIPFIIYSQFAGDSDGPTLLRTFAEQRGYRFSFEPLRSRPASVSAHRAADVVARLIVAASLAQRHPKSFQASVEKHSPDHAWLVQISDRIEQSYRKQGITHFHDGFVSIRPNP